MSLTNIDTAHTSRAFADLVAPPLCFQHGFAVVVVVPARYVLSWPRERRISKVLRFTTRATPAKALSAPSRAAAGPPRPSASEALLLGRSRDERPSASEELLRAREEGSSASEELLLGRARDEGPSASEELVLTRKGR